MNPRKLTIILMLTLAAMVVLQGCAYVEYQHLSDPRISDDGYDLVCAGLTTEGNLTVSGGVCSNLAPYGGEFLTINARYTWERQ